MVDTEGNIKLSDFGSANIINNSYLNSFIGTGCWMAPEIINKNGHERFADIWSLGCTVFEMLTGKPPFLKSTYFKTLESVWEFKIKNFNFPSHFSDLAKDFLK